MLDVYKGANGIMRLVAPPTNTCHNIHYSTVKEDSLLIDSSTIDPAVSKDIAAELSDKNIGYLDAPVSGGVANYRYGRG